MNKNKADILDEIFTEEWYNDVKAVTNFALDHSNKFKMEPEALAQYIIDYNITKRLQEKVIENLVDTLPKVIDWKDKAVTMAFLEFKDLVDCCSICPKFKTYKVRIKNINSGVLLNEFYLWKELVNSDYPNLFLTIVPLKTKHQFRLEIKKSKKSMS